jgi:transcriptional regulator with XRE-family HTH domain
MPSTAETRVRPNARLGDHAEGVELGEILRRERHRAELYQREVSAAAGITQARLSKYESGVLAPTWDTFVRVLAALGRQPRIVVEPLDADVDACLADWRTKPRDEWLDDVAPQVPALLRLLEGIEWVATGLLAARLHGAPVPLARFSVDAVVGTQGWERLTRNAMAVPVQVWDPEIEALTVPTSPTELRCAADARAGHLRWLLPGGFETTMRVVTLLTPRCVSVEQAGRRWATLPLDLIADEDAWTSRVLQRLHSRDLPAP